MNEWEFLVEEAVAAARQAVEFDQDVDPEIVRMLLAEIDRLRGLT